MDNGQWIMDNFVWRQQIFHSSLFTFHFFIVLLQRVSLKTNEEMAQVGRDSGIHTRSAVHHTRRTALRAAHTELGGAEGCIYRL